MFGTAHYTMCDEILLLHVKIWLPIKKRKKENVDDWHKAICSFPHIKCEMQMEAQRLELQRSAAAGELRAKK